MPSNWENMYRHNEELTMENTELRAELQSAQAVIDAAQVFGSEKASYEKVMVTKDEWERFSAALAAHLSRYPPKGVT